jgi:hypothetical protein
MLRDPASTEVFALCLCACDQCSCNRELLTKAGGALHASDSCVCSQQRFPWNWDSCTPVDPLDACLAHMLPQAPDLKQPWRPSLRVGLLHSPGSNDESLDGSAFEAVDELTDVLAGLLRSSHPLDHLGVDGVRVGW